MLEQSCLSMGGNTQAPFRFAEQGKTWQWNKSLPLLYVYWSGAGLELCRVHTECIAKYYEELDLLL
jgi:hypothetical protein